MPQPLLRQNLSSLNACVDEHESRIDALEIRLAKYDVIIARLDTLIDVLTKHIDHIEERTEEAIEGQKIIEEKNAGVHRWATIGIALSSSLVVDVLCFVLGYVLH